MTAATTSMTGQPTSLSCRRSSVSCCNTVHRDRCSSPQSLMCNCCSPLQPFSPAHAQHNASHHGFTHNCRVLFLAGLRGQRTPLRSVRLLKHSSQQSKHSLHVTSTLGKPAQQPWSSTGGLRLSWCMLDIDNVAEVMTRLGNCTCSGGAGQSTLSDLPA